MGYIKTILWLCGYPIVWILCTFLFIISLFVIFFNMIFGKECGNYFHWTKLLVSYEDILNNIK